MRYRSEIDGLRAVAVIPVILFHAGFGAFGGGFIGVDVFFVISGYLITSLILEEMDEGKFSLANFYERRARRILPALFFVMAFCIPPAWLWLRTREFLDFAQSIVAVTTFSSNILFWFESGYFDTAAELKPLLHTWSLAVEEQYYILFPLFLMLTWKLGRQRLLVLLAVIAIISLGVAHWGTYNWPSFAFYMLPTRGWEILTGALVAVYFSSTRKPGMGSTFDQALSLLGLLLIGLSVFVFDAGTPFPGFYALVPVLGTALVIVFASDRTFVHRILSTRVMVGTGLISYSAYLWHQPLYAFAKYRSLSEPSAVLMVSLTVLSLSLAYLTWKYVEIPFRSRGVISRHGVVATFTILTSFFILAGFGLDLRYGEYQRQMISFLNYPFAGIYRSGSCFLEPEQDFTQFDKSCLPAAGSHTLIWGDSHAAALSYGVRKRFKGASQLTASVCPPLLGKTFDSRPHCRQINDYVLDVIGETAPHRVLLHANWYLYEINKVHRIDDLLAGLERTLVRLKEVSPASEIFVIGGVPQWEPELPIFIAETNTVSGDDTFLVNEWLDEINSIDEELRAVAMRHSVRFLAPTDVLCRDSRCLTMTSYGDASMPTAWDGAHLTAGGSVYVVEGMFDSP